MLTLLVYASEDPLQKGHTLKHTPTCYDNDKNATLLFGCINCLGNWASKPNHFCVMRWESWKAQLAYIGWWLIFFFFPFLTFFFGVFLVFDKPVPCLITDPNWTKSAIACWETRLTLIIHFNLLFNILFDHDYWLTYCHVVFSGRSPGRDLLLRLLRKSAWSMDITSFATFSFFAFYVGVVNINFYFSLLKSITRFLHSDYYIIIQCFSWLSNINHFNLCSLKLHVNNKIKTINNQQMQKSLERRTTLMFNKQLLFGTNDRQ